MCALFVLNSAYVSGEHFPFFFLILFLLLSLSLFPRDLVKGNLNSVHEGKLDRLLQSTPAMNALSGQTFVPHISPEPAARRTFVKSVLTDAVLLQHRPAAEISSPTDSGWWA